MVVKRGMNDHEILPMARRFKGSGVILRFIEYMGVGASNGWKKSDVIPSADVVRHIDASMPLEQIVPNYPGETASRWRYRDGGGEIGLISSVTGAFCHDCTRARLSAEGKLYTCLFATGGKDLRNLIREGRSDSDISTAIALIWSARTDRYSELHSAPGSAVAGMRSGMVTPSADDAVGKRVEMSYIGG
jgi:cyclic pyranopterin phosphate synthase